MALDSNLYLENYGCNPMHTYQEGAPLMTYFCVNLNRIEELMGLRELDF